MQSGLPLVMILDDHASHRFDYGYDTRADAWIVPADRRYLPFVPLHIDCPLGNRYGGCRLDDDSEHDVRPGADTADDPAGMVRPKPLRVHLVVMFTSPHGGGLEARPEFNALNRSNGQHRLCPLSVKLVEYGCS